MFDRTITENELCAKVSATGSHLLLRALSEELARCGLRHACTSPGSRSAPIVLALVREAEISCLSHVDERSSGFFALGLAKSSGRPVAIACTSGTAAANLAPAVIEAAHARVPLIVLTADRPPELREVGAGQTIDQLRLYGSAAKWFFEVGIDTATVETMRFIRALACRAYWTAIDGPPGPVHLNFPLREPLIPPQPLPEDPVPARPDGRPWVSFDSPPPVSAQRRLPSEARTLIVAGAGSPRGLAELAADAGVPVLGDPLSGARSGPAAIAHYDLLLRGEVFAAAQRPELVIRVGDLPTSKPLRSWLASLECEQVAIDRDRTWQDPDAVVAERLATLPAELPRAPDDNWLRGWRGADDAVAAALAAALGDRLSEPLVAARLAAWLPSEATLVAASSMPIRDLETFVAARENPPRMLSNRGTNGIDGTVSSGLGAAYASGQPTVLLTGDLALLHDIGGLMASSRLGIALTIVVLNNDGGGIFHFLPIAGQEDAFEEHVATPHGLDLGQAAALFGA
ncbi:MAG: 2-succinyl-5-enolpyruvyl-6-hydroxy-3-cyclohexene-1-carboxylic-acid synthase, partial [Solirubrobacterales bacterium]|nr:2-succinyl-5-enolpyruvyl-6-hydroxy-3-cyclohexene-1-carboxylic-acid synthase [Solirubrobacterales bacterium]